MSKLAKRILMGIGTFLVAFGLCWYGGMEIFERSLGNAMALGYSLVIAIFVACCPAID